MLHSFERDVDGAYPTAGVVQGSDGRLYGTTPGGGVGSGSVFRMDADGSNFTELHTFNSSFGNPYFPNARLLAAGGQLFGTAAYGGQHAFGAVFRLNLDGTGFQVLHHFNEANPLDGSTPVSALMLGADGLLYGTTMRGGEHRSGTAFRLNPAGGGFERLHSFDGSNPLDGERPESALVQVGPTAFMGTTTVGGLYKGGGQVGGGIVYKLDVSTSPPAFKVLRVFQNCCFSPYGTYPHGGLVSGAGRWAYGVTSTGGTSASGTIYAISSNGTTRLLHSFTVGDGGNPWGGLTIGADGSLYGTTQGGGTNGAGVLFRLRFDSDGDSVPDPLDNCPTAANPLQADSDGDGIGDGCPADTPPLPEAGLTLGTLRFTYDGTPKVVTVTTTPADAGQTGSVAVTYNGSLTPPTSVGAYLVVASLTSLAYSADPVTALMVISKATPVVTWNNPADIFNPAPLSGVELNATANVPGTFAYTPALGAILPVGLQQTLSVVSHRPISSTTTSPPRRSRST